MSLSITHLSVSLEEKDILHDISLSIDPGTVHVLMGPNGSGKSTMAAALMGDEKYVISEHACIKINETDVTSFATDERARAGLFLAFQTPVAVPGVTVAHVVRAAHTSGKHMDRKEEQASVFALNKRLVSEATSLGLSQEFLRKSLNEAFSGGEKKKLEMLQAIMLKPSYAVFDEIDTGLDVDALKIVSSGIERLTKEGCGVLIITHYQRILQYVHPDHVHILVKGKIVKQGGKDLVEEVEQHGYKQWMTT